jgi:hypothetical protein
LGPVFPPTETFSQRGAFLPHYGDIFTAGKCGTVCKKLLKLFKYFKMFKLIHILIQYS